MYFVYARGRDSNVKNKKKALVTKFLITEERPFQRRISTEQSNEKEENLDRIMFGKTLEDHVLTAVRLPMALCLFKVYATSTFGQSNFKRQHCDIFRLTTSKHGRCRRSE